MILVQLNLTLMARKHVINMLLQMLLIIIKFNLLKEDVHDRSKWSRIVNVMKRKSNPIGKTDYISII